MKFSVILLVAQCLTLAPVERPANVFVTLSYDYALCCEGRECKCRECYVHQCKLTRSMSRVDFDAARLSQYSACTVTQLTPGDGYGVQCGVCEYVPRVCRYDGRDYADRDVRCVTSLNRASCGWF